MLGRRMCLIRIAPIAVALALALSSNAAASTVVTIQFDDGNADAYAAGQLLADRGMHATFYVNSGAIGSAGHMSWTQLHDLVAAGNEIGGHTLEHKNLKTLPTAGAGHQVCDERT